MTDNSQISDEMVQDYIDGRLNERDQATMAAFLLANPDQAAEIQELRQHNEALSGLGSEVLNEPVPERLAQVIASARENKQNTHEIGQKRRERWIRFQGATQAAAVMMIFIGGVVLGWFSHNYFRFEPDTDNIALLTAADAYGLYSTNASYPVDFPPDKETEFGAILKQVFQKQIRRPDLGSFGYQYVGGRVLPAARGQQGMYLFQNEAGQRVAVVFWRSKSMPRRLKQALPDKNLGYEVVWRNGVGYAILGNRIDKKFPNVTANLSGFYSKAD